MEISAEHFDDMLTLGDTAFSYLKKNDIENAVKTYQKIIDQKDAFRHVLDSELGKAYLFTKNYEEAAKVLEDQTPEDYTQGLFLAFAHLKKGDREKFKEKFDKWISECLENSFEHDLYKECISAFFTEDESKFIEDVWNEYFSKYSNMEAYQLYCELCDQNHIKPGKNDEEYEDKALEIPAKVSRSKFEELKEEYLHLNRITRLKNAKPGECDRFFELQELLFVDIIFS